MEVNGFCFSPLFLVNPLPSLWSQTADSRTTTYKVIFQPLSVPKNPLFQVLGWHFHLFPSFCPPSSQLILLVPAPHLPSFPPSVTQRGKILQNYLFIHLQRGLFFFSFWSRAEQWMQKKPCSSLCWFKQVWFNCQLGGEGSGAFRHVGHRAQLPKGSMKVGPPRCRHQLPFH